MVSTSATYLEAKTVVKMVREVSADILKKPGSEIILGANYTDDLRADSLDMVDLVAGLEEKVEEVLGFVEFEISDQEAENLHTVRDVVEFILQRGYPAAA